MCKRTGRERVQAPHCADSAAAVQQRAIGRASEIRKGFPKPFRLQLSSCFLLYCCFCSTTSSYKHQQGDTDFPGDGACCLLACSAVCRHTHRRARRHGCASAAAMCLARPLLLSNLPMTNSLSLLPTPRLTYFDGFMLDDFQCLNNIVKYHFST